MSAPARAISPPGCSCRPAIRDLPCWTPTPPAWRGCRSASAAGSCIGRRILPFGDGGVAFLHSSHLIEHLAPADLYTLLGEVDRVLAPGGILAISAPLLSPTFYSDLSHLKPYNPEVLRSYLVAPRRQRTRAGVSQQYTVLEQVYRLNSRKPFQELGSDLAPLDLLIQIARFGLRQLRVRTYTRTGFTLILRKQPPDPAV